MRLSGQKEFVIRFTGPFAKVENLTVISTSKLLPMSRTLK